ncbi:protein NRT1/ PTR FAMILY 1.2-like [Nicotiana tabacum]|uniref:Protein NRT1/ PTR FAMILY 1.2-like n=1 Tax=Nicotiana tabacum TaxID=4097 RepID=A0A1S4B2X6_TOBAC|nr:PREDICTED: protein NRT1/ PTR FAMILY 1.2-like [Nicotiana tabacum]XP_016483301.1 PREDICTED: protein NRT1/ PTR FAMILY 1.2-like [Nicotiana tabacum]
MQMGRDIELEENPRKGGLRTMPFIIVNESFERVASYGLQTNMIIYLMTFYQMSAATGASILGIWTALSNGLAIVGAIISDSYLGRFRAVAIGSIFTLVGMIILWLTAMIPQLKPLPCPQFQHICNGATAVQLVILFSSFGFMSVGAGFVRPCSIIFGADQFEKKENTENQRLVDSYFNWYYASIGISTIFAVTIIVYIQDRYGWQVGFGIPVILMFFSVSMFLIGYPLYIKVKAKESLLIGLLQAAVAASKKRHTSLPLTDCDDCYHRPLESAVLEPLNDFRCLNRACMIQDPQRDLNPDGSASNPWSLCSVEQVESLKALLRVLPMWTSGIMIFVTTSQFSFSVLQTKTMDRHMFPQFEIPAASFSMFMIIALTIWITFYDRVLVPLLSKYIGLARGLSPIIRMGIGLIVSCVSMALSAITESIRRQRAIEEGHNDDPSALVNMSAMWFVPQYALLGVAEAAHAVGQIEFFYSLLPKSMSSIASAMYTIGTAMSSLVGSLLVSGVDWLTSTRGKTSWLSSNINRGHLDYYFWLLAFLSLLNFLYFLVVCRYYEPGNDRSCRLPHESEEQQCDYRLLTEY